MATSLPPEWSQESLDTTNMGSLKRAAEEENMTSYTDNLMADQIEIPEITVGAVIGKGGSEIQSIQARSRCQVQIGANGSDVNGLRTVSLKGTLESIELAKRIINDIVVSRLKPIPNSHGAFTTVDVQIDGDKCGLIVGKNGETIRALQERTGCKIQLIQENNALSTASKPLRISGRPDQVAAVQSLVAELIGTAPSRSCGDPMNRNIQEFVRGEVIVPRESVGMIIGKGGETIKKIGMDTGTKIQFKQDDDHANERCAIIIGRKDQIYHASNIIKDIVEKTMRLQGTKLPQEEFNLRIPAKKAGLVIGKGGESIRQINNESGAHVEFSRDCLPEDEERTCVIRGRADQIKYAVHLIKMKIGEIPPNSRFVPEPNSIHFSNMGVQQPYMGRNHPQMMPHQMNQYGGYRQNPPYEMQSNMAQQQMVMGGGMPHQQQQQNNFYPQYGNQNNSAMMQPTNNQMFHQSPQQQSFYPQGSIAPAPAQPSPQLSTQINTSTGQPDYSAQWAQYYRLMGMHEQANMVEKQMKETASSSIGEMTDMTSQAASQAIIGQPNQGF